MAVQGVSGTASQAVSQSKPAKRQTIQDEIMGSVKKPEAQTASANTDAVKTEPKQEHLSIQQELLTYGATGKKAAAAQPAPAANTAAAAADSTSTQGAPAPKKHMSIQNEILGYGKDKQVQTSDADTTPTEKTSA